MAVQIRVNDIGDGRFSYRKKVGTLWSGELTKAEMTRLKASVKPEEMNRRGFLTLPAPASESGVYGNIRGGIDVNMNMSVENRKLLYDKSVEMFKAGVEAGIPMSEIKTDIETFIAPAIKGPAQGFGTIGKSAPCRKNQLFV